jgi:hypothetical protein
MKTALAAVLALSTLSATIAPAAAAFGPSDLPTMETSPGFFLPGGKKSTRFNPRDLPQGPGPGHSIWLEDNK